jgi:hypothetical protein
VPGITVVCSVSEAAHHDELPGLYGPAAYTECAARLRRALQAAAPQAPPPNVSVKFAPLGLLPISDSFFVLPAAAPAAAGARAGGRPLGYGTEAHAADSDSDDEQGGAGAAPGAQRERAQGVSLLAHALAHAAAALGCRAEAFCLGPASRAVGRSLSFVAPVSPPGGGPPPTQSAAFLLVDRAADLVAPALHADLLVGRMLGARSRAAHPAQPASQQQEAAGRSGADAAPAGPSAASGPDASADGGGEFFLPASLAHPHDAHAAPNLGFLLTRQGRDGALFVRKWLREAARREGAAAAGRFRPGAASAAELRALCAALGADPAAALRHSSLLQLAGAAAAALEGGAAAGWEAAAGRERALLAACQEGGAAAAAEQLADVLAAAGRSGSDLELPAAVDLLLIAYCLLPEQQAWYAADADGRCTAFSPEQEAALRDALAAAALACSARWTSDAEAQQAAPWLPAPLRAKLRAAAAAAGGRRGGEGLRALQLEVRLAAEDLLRRLRELSLFRQRTGGATGRGAGGEGQGGGGAGGAPPPALLRRLAAAALDRRPVEGLARASTSLAGLLRGGLGRMGLQRQPQPGDHSVIVLFVVGGVGCGEAQEVAAAVEERLAAAAAAAAAGGPGGAVAAPPRVVVGGSVLLRPDEVGARALAAR